MKRIRMILGPLALAVGLAACSGGSGGSSPAVASPGSGPQIVAKDMKFQQTKVELPANKVDSVAFVSPLASVFLSLAVAAFYLPSAALFAER